MLSEIARDETLDSKLYINNEKNEFLLTDDILDKANEISIESYEDTAILNEEFLFRNPYYDESTSKYGVFYLKKKPKISLMVFIDRIVEYTDISKSTFAYSFALIEKFLLKNPKYVLSSNNYFLLLLISVVVSLKIQEDCIYNNQVYAKIGGITLSKINELEKSFLDSLEFRVYITEEELTKFTYFKAGMIDVDSKEKKNFKYNKAESA